MLAFCLTACRLTFWPSSPKPSSEGSRVASISEGPGQMGEVGRSTTHAASSETLLSSCLLQSAFLPLGTFWVYCCVAMCVHLSASAASRPRAVHGYFIAQYHKHRCCERAVHQRELGIFKNDVSYARRIHWLTIRVSSHMEGRKSVFMS